MLASLVLTLMVGIKGFKSNRMLGRYFLIAISIVIVAVAAGWTDEYGITTLDFL